MVQNNQKEKIKAAKKTNTRKSGNSCGLGVSLGKPTEVTIKKKRLKQQRNLTLFQLESVVLMQ